MTQQIDARAAKEQQHQQWSKAAAGWRKHDARLREGGAPVVEKLLELVVIAPGMRVLDIACGTGEPALPAARLVGPAGFVLATDIAGEMLEVAREKAEAQGITNVEFRRVDGEELDVEPNSFDAITCRWGLMFMPEPLKCLKSAHRALKPGGRIAAAVWGPPDRNPFFTIPASVLAAHIQIPAPDPSAHGPFALADQSKLDFLFTQAGFRAARIESLEWPFAVFDSGHEYWTYTRELAAPIAALFEKVPEDARDLVSEQIAAKAAGGDPNGKVSLNGYTLLASAIK